MIQSDLGKHIQEVNIQKLVVMVLTPVLLFFSVLLSIFTPYPVGLSAVLYGRKVGAIVAIFSTIAFCALMVFGADGINLSLAGLFVLSLIFGISISELVKRDINPMKGIVIVGGVVALIASGLVVSSLMIQKTSLKAAIISQIELLKPTLEEQQKVLKESGEEGAFEMAAVLNQPEVLAMEVIKVAPSYFMVSLILTLWINFFLVLKSHRLVKGVNGQFTEQFLLKYKLPDQLIWLVILFLGLFLLEEYEGMEMAGAIGLTGLSTLGVFYFFQGFGIYLAFLDSFKVTGFVRTLLVVATVMMANKMIAIIGLLDMFLDFKKMMNKND